MLRLPRMAVICFGLVLVGQLAAQDADEKSTELLKTFAGEFVAITPGEGKFPASYQMGVAEGDVVEQPRHSVTIAKKFAIAKYEVPQNLYQAVMGTNPSRWKGPRNSVEMMTWKDANQFCQKITTALREKKLIANDEVIRLPTEAEWEYCCRAGTTTRYSFGDAAQLPDQAGKFDVVLASFGNNKLGLIKLVREQTDMDLKDAKELVESLPKSLKTGISAADSTKLKESIQQAGGSCFVRPVMVLSKFAWHTDNAAGNDPAVGELQPNPWGLYDMHGYLWEFTADGWSDSYANAPADGSAVKADADKGQIVLRGGSWKDKFGKLTSTFRQRYQVTEADDAVGFRCVKSGK